MARLDHKTLWLPALLAGLSGLPAMGAAPPGGGSTPADPAIVFVGTPGSGPTISVMNADGAKRTVILPMGAGFFWSPSWSPDGRSICFGIGGTLTNGSHHVGLAAIDIGVVNGNPVGSNFRMLVNAANGAYFPAWSPDGATIAYTLNSEGIYTIPASGGEPTLLYAGSDLYTNDLAWSPDGTQIAYSTWLLGPPTLKVLDVASGSTFQVCSLNGASDIGQIDWGRTNGNRIAFNAYAQSGSGKFVYTVEAVPGATPQLIASTSWFPTWSPDDSRIAYTKGSNDSIVVHNLQTGAVASTGARGRFANWRRF